MNKELYDFYIIDKKHIDKRIEAKEVCDKYASLNLPEEERMLRRKACS